ncbi:MAG: Pycsar system effector family protein [Nanoarchaeota archaeon]
MKTDTKILSDYLSRALAQQQELIRLADTKASVVLTLIGVILSLFFNYFISKNSVSIIPIILIISLFVISGLFSFIAIYPRKGNSNEKNSLLYYGSAKNIQKNFLSPLIKNEEEKIISDYVENVKSIAGIVEKKFNFLRYSYIFLAIAILIKIIVEFSSWIK